MKITIKELFLIGACFFMICGWVYNVGATGEINSKLLEKHDKKIEELYKIKEDISYIKGKLEEALK